MFFGGMALTMEADMAESALKDWTFVLEVLRCR
jgi:hypothetical protein